MSIYTNLASQFKSETGLDAKTNVATYCAYLQAHHLSQVVVALTEINNRITEVKKVVEISSQKK